MQSNNMMITFNERHEYYTQVMWNCVITTNNLWAFIKLIYKHLQAHCPLPISSTKPIQYTSG